MAKKYNLSYYSEQADLGKIVEPDRIAKYLKISKLRLAVIIGLMEVNLNRKSPSWETTGKNRFYQFLKIIAVIEIWCKNNQETLQWWRWHSIDCFYTRTPEEMFKTKKEKELLEYVERLAIEIKASR